jgi:GNAT superfamily N-acetyltransferase
VTDAAPQPADTSRTGTLVACGPEQREEQARLYAACFKKPLAERGLEWRYDDVPHGPSVSFVTRESGGATVSGYACNPRLAISRGDESTAAIVGETGDVMTHPDWRKRGYFSALDRAAMEEAKRRGWVLAFGLPNHRSAHIFLELGWERIGTVRRWTYLLDAGAAARAERSREGWLRGVLAPLDALRCARKSQRQRRSHASERERMQLGVAYYDRFPQQLAPIARAVERRFGFMIRRDPDYLRWRFLAAPSRQHTAILVHAGGGDGNPETDDEQVAGYAVLQSRAGADTCFLVDVLGRDDATIDTAIDLALDEAQCRGHKLVQATAIDGTWWSKRLQSWGFLPPRGGSEMSVIMNPLQPAHPLVAAARDISNWYFTDGDRDDETVG